MEDEFALMQSMTDQQRQLFAIQMQGRRKNPTTAILLNLFLGGVGAHHFYLGRTVVGAIYVLFFWTFIPLLISLFELFLTTADFTREYNQRTAEEVAKQIRALSPSA